MFLVTGLFAQKTCIFVSSEQDPGHSNDQKLKDWLIGKGYVVTVADDDEIKDGTAWYTLEDLKTFDLGFISESSGSGNIKLFRGAPIPTVTLEMWGSKWDVYGWVPKNTVGTYYENSKEGTIKILDGSHPLAAGLATGAEVEIVSGSSGTPPDDARTCYTNPQIDHIAVAELLTSTAEFPHKNVVGVEAGTALYEAEKADGELPDGSLVTENRMAGVGISFLGNDFLTENGYKLIEAAIDWVLAGATAIEDEPLASPAEYKLNQNYPNPFNPSTQISFTLKENGRHTTLKVYDALGKEVARLMDGMATQGTHIINFDASNLNSGVYFYQLVSGNYTETRKMMLIK